mgnify:CR=1 FL=1
MSIQTWRDEFYKEEACYVSEKKAVKHSLKKWKGLTKANLKRHHLDHDGVYIFDDDGADFDIDDSTCALCCAYGNECNVCPLAIARDGIACYEVMDDENESPYGAWIHGKDAKPMIGWLKEARKIK